MNYDLKLIKDKYGEDMMHFCRRLFPTLLEEKGLLFDLLSNHFEFSKQLYDDIIENKLTGEFQNYVMCLAKLDRHYKEDTEDKDPEQLLSEAGYNLFECHSEEEIESFIKYYADGERLCTFGDERLKSSYVFFAVKKNVDEIKREDFENPARQDEYGTSVISIQFTRGYVNHLGIMNRYNHVKGVDNPDATFSNNLDNIIPGLTKAFEKKYGFHIHSDRRGFDIKNYVKGNDGKLYKYLFEKNGIYYCPNNTIIDAKYNVHKFDKEKYIIMDYYVIDLVNKTIKVFDDNIRDSFIDGFKNIKSIRVVNNKKTGIKTVTINDEITIDINSNNRLINYYNPNVTRLDNSFIGYNNDAVVERLHLPNVIEVEDDFFEDNKTLKEILLDSVISIGDGFMKRNRDLHTFYAPNVVFIGNRCLECNEELRVVDLPNVREIASCFMIHNKNVSEVRMDNVKILGDYFMNENNSLKVVYFPNVEEIKNNFMLYNNSVVCAKFPKLKVTGDAFFYSDEVLKVFYAPNLYITGHRFMRYNKSIEDLDTPNLTYLGSYFMENNAVIKVINLESAKKLGSYFAANATGLEKVYLPNAEEIGGEFALNARNIEEVYIPNINEESYGKLSGFIKEKLNKNGTSKKIGARRYFVDNTSV